MRRIAIPLEAIAEAAQTVQVVWDETGVRMAVWWVGGTR